MNGLPALPLVLLVAATACGQATQPVSPDETAASIERAVVRLADEAREAQLRQSLPAAPDYAARCDLDLAPADVAAAIRTRHFRKVFIDAYIRWQLTSFDPPLGIDGDPALRNLVRDGPGLVRNPWASHRSVRLFRAMADMGPLGEQEATYVRERRERLDGDLARVERFNRPIHDLRAWLAARIADDPVHRAAWLVGECVARADAGWPVPGTDLVADTAAALAAVTADPSIPADRRAWLADMVRDMTEHDAAIVTEVAIADDGTLHATIVNAAVDVETAARWEAMLRDGEASKD